jgi:Arc/MetJ-type ribon-helix-helix transcriptional regulator
MSHDTPRCRHVVLDDVAERAAQRIAQSLRAEGLRANRSECIRYALVRAAAEIAPIANSIV